MLTPRLEQQFIDSADFKYQCGQTLAAPLSAAVEAMLAALTAGGRVWCVGAGPTAGLASYASHLLTHGFERDRPELSSMPLHQGDGDEAATMLKRLRAHVAQDDVLWVMSLCRSERTLIPVIEAAQDRGITVIALVAGEGGDLMDSLLDTDVVVSIVHPRVSRMLEGLHMAIHAVCDGIDLQLLGEES